MPIIFIHNNKLQLNKNVVIMISNIANLLRDSFQVRLKNGVNKNKYTLTSFQQNVEKYVK